MPPPVAPESFGADADAPVFGEPGGFLGGTRQPQRLREGWVSLGKVLQGMEFFQSGMGGWIRGGMGLTCGNHLLSLRSK